MRTSCRMIWREFECLLITEFLRASQKERTILGKGIESAREKLREREQTTLTYFGRGSIIVQLTSCLNGLD